MAGFLVIPGCAALPVFKLGEQPLDDVALLICDRIVGRGISAVRQERVAAVTSSRIAVVASWFLRRLRFRRRLRSRLARTETSDLLPLTIGAGLSR